MANIIDYARGASGPALRFRDMNAADALALTLLSWLDWDGLSGEGVELSRAAQALGSAYDGAAGDAEQRRDGVYIDEAVTGTGVAQANGTRPNASAENAAETGVGAGAADVAGTKPEARAPHIAPTDNGAGAANAASAQSLANLQGGIATVNAAAPMPVDAAAYAPDAGSAGSGDARTPLGSTASDAGRTDAAAGDADAVDVRSSGATSVQSPGAELELARVMAASPRYGSLKLYGFERADMTQPAMQFAALTLWDGHDAYLAFRGTDSSLAGWFEDIQLAYAEATPSQVRAREYLERAARRFGGGLYLGGHSKGGALALYAAVNAGAVQPRIRRVYSFDGPGVSRAAYQSARYARLRARLLTIVPPESVVGMLLWQDGEMRVVRSDARGVRQHDPMSWLTDSRGLVYAAELSQASLRLRDVARALLSALPPQGIEQLANSLYALVLSTGARTLGELSRYFASHPDVLGQVQQDAGGRAMYTLLYLMATAAGGDAQTSERQQREALESLPGLGV